MSGEQSKHKISRRGMIALGTLGIIALSPAAAMARTVEDWRSSANRWAKPKVVFERSLSFRHRHTGENLERRVYYADGRYLPDALKEINHLLRDFRNDEVRSIDPGLLDLLYALKLRTEAERPFEIYSGYRSPETNALLRRGGVGVARNSLHMQGKAIDIALPGVEANDLFRAAWSLQRGGVGFYGGSTFVHVDVGEVRTWRG